MVLKEVIAPIEDPRGKFRPHWLRLYIIKTIPLGGTVKLLDMDDRKYTLYTNLNQLKKYYA